MKTAVEMCQELGLVPGDWIVLFEGGAVWKITSFHRGMLRLKCKGGNMVTSHWLQGLRRARPEEIPAELQPS